MTEDTAARKRSTLSRHKSVLAITKSLLREKSGHAKLNRRGREILVLHDGDGDTLQRMLNAIEPGSYIRPHRHVTPPKAEGLIVLAGAVGFVPFTSSGQPDEASFVHMGGESEVLGVDYRAGVWHSFFALEPGTVVYEVKPGPYEATSDKEFAPWAPEEGAPEAELYLADLEKLFRGTVGLPITR